MKLIRDLKYRRSIAATRVRIMLVCLAGIGFCLWFMLLAVTPMAESDKAFFGIGWALCLAASVFLVTVKR